VRDADRPLGVIHILDSGALGGGPRALLTTARGLRAFGWASSALCGDDGPLAGDLARLDIPAEALPITGQSRFLARMPALIRRLRRYRPDAVIIYGPIAGCLGGMAARAAGVPLVVYSAQYPSYYADHDWLRRLRNATVERIACACADAVWCLSTADRDLYRKRQPRRTRKLHIIPNCVSDDIFLAIQRHSGGTAPGVPVPGTYQGEEVAAFRAYLGLPPTDRIIGFVGRLVPEKGLDVLLRAYRLVQRALPSVRLMIVGEGPEKPMLEHLASELGIAERIVFAGPQRDVVPYYLLADVIAVPSRYEPFGIVAIEAMAAARPVVASRTGGLLDSVQDGVCGRLAEPGNPDALANALLWVLQSPAQAQQLGARARERALQEYTEGKMSNRVNQLLVTTPRRRS
jgi:glycosyltransferase involved in cell wall biosynthesis